MARRTLSLAALLEGLGRGDRAVIGQAITLVESRNPTHRALAEELLEALSVTAPTGLRIGVTGVPGVGKSTFIDAFGQQLIASGRRVGVLAVDPSSARSGGSILGDKTRMGILSGHLDAFIRPSPTAGTLGGIATRTREAIRVLEAAGYDTILVETVGVGQSEIAVANITDLFMLLALPGSGDELQGIKRGIMEMADLVLVTKADGDQRALAHRARTQLTGALRLLHGHRDAPPVLEISALEGHGLSEALDLVCSLHAAAVADGSFEARRADQAVHWLWTLVDEGLRRLVRDRVGETIARIEQAVRGGELSVIAAARRVLSELPEAD